MHKNEKSYCGGKPNYGDGAGERVVDSGVVGAGWGGGSLIVVVGGGVELVGGGV